MKIEKNSLLLTVFISVLTILSMVSVVGATSTGPTLSLDGTPKDVPVGGKVDFIVTLQTDDMLGMISWNIAREDPITAKLEKISASNSIVAGGLKSGYVNIITPPTTQAFKLTVTAGNGAVVGQQYFVNINYCTEMGFCTTDAAIATAQAGVIPTPELSPSILTAVGLIGLIGLVRMRRKD